MSVMKCVFGILLGFICFFVVSCSEENAAPSEKTLSKVDSLPDAETVLVQEEKPEQKFDSIKLIETRKVFNHTYYVFRRYDYETANSLQIDAVTEKDSTTVFDDFLYLKGGDCNARVKWVSTYKITGDKFIFYTLTEDVEMFDITNPHYSERVLKETYAIQKAGPIVRLKTESGLKDSLINAEVRSLLQEALDTITEY